MKREDFFKQNDERFFALGFVRDEEDSMFYYEKSLLSDDQIEESDLDEDDVPKLLFGNTGINRGFCIFTGTHFVWLNSETPEDAVKIANAIVSIEEC